MYILEKDKDITNLTTFKVPVKAKFYAEYTSEKELLALSRSKEFIENQVLHIGGGSNLLFLGDFDGMVVHSAIKGIKEYRKDENTLYVIAGAGEKWTDLVEWTLERGYSGLENLSYIPGDVGASAVQNVGAYGVEAGDLIHAVECFDVIARKSVTFTKHECNFAYRDSIFKREGKGRYIVMRVSYKLNLSGEPKSLNYGPLRELEKRLGRIPSIREVADEVISIRRSKLPDPAEIGSAGSFFKNPVVTRRKYEVLKEDYPTILGYEVGNDEVKLSAAWLIDQCGLKGTRIGGAEVYRNQPLVLVNIENASGYDVRKLADEVVTSVRSKFYVNLKPEVNMIQSEICIAVLGSGTSKGVPEVGCRCRVCTSEDQHDKRLRASVLVENMGMRILIDPSPDFREQALREGITDIDAVLVTHTHYDHVGGFDDLRPFCGYQDIPVYLQESVNKDLHKRLDYCFREVRYPGVPRFETIVVDKDEFFVNGLKITPIEVMHGKMPVLGYRIGDFAYVTDAKTICDSELEKLENLEVLILNGLRDKDHFAHLTIEEALSIIEKVKPKHAYLTHFCHEAGLHSELEARFPKNVFPCYDGLKIKIPGNISSKV